jgi:hypothetical protein
MKIRLPLILFLFLFTSAETASAFPTSCTPTENGTPVCAFWTRADVVFLGKALKVEDAPKNEDFPAGARKIRFQVQQNFKGADNPTFTVVATADCGLNIKSGQTWIIYAGNDIVLKSFSAFRGARVEPKITNNEAETLKNISAGNSQTAISGRFASIAQNGRYTFDPVEISITGSGKLLTSKTDPDGAFNIPVPDGNYKVELKFPYKAGFNWNENLLGTSLVEGVPTVFRYEVRLNDGDCNFNFFEVSRKTQ